MALQPLDKLRLYLGERIPTGGAATDTFFSDDELNDILNSVDGLLNSAAVLGWSAKASEYARLIDMTESGGDRKLSQRYRQALTQLQFFQAQADKEILSLTASGRVVGRSIPWGNNGCDQIVLYSNTFHNMPAIEGAVCDD